MTPVIIGYYFLTCNLKYVHLSVTTEINTNYAILFEQDEWTGLLQEHKITLSGEMHPYLTKGHQLKKINYHQAGMCVCE